MNSILYGPSGLRWLMLLGWMIVIFAFSSQPNSSHTTAQLFGPLNFWARKLAHVTEYAILFLLAQRAFVTTRLGRARSAARLNLCSLFFCLLYACSDEFHQCFVPGRSPSAGDVGIDTLGMLSAWLILYLVQRCMSRQLR